MNVFVLEKYFDFCSSNTNMLSKIRWYSCTTFWILILYTAYCTSAEDTATIGALNERINGELYGGFFKEKK